MIFLAAGFWYAFKELHIEPIIVILTAASALTAIHFNQKKVGLDEPKTEYYSQLDFSNPIHRAYVEGLPAMKGALNAGSASDERPGGTTADMIDSAHDDLSQLQTIWLELAKFYPQNHFNDMSHKDFITHHIDYVSTVRYALHQPDGNGTGGTILGPMIAVDLWCALDDLIVETVAALSLDGLDDSFDLSKWRDCWKAGVSYHDRTK